MLAQTVRVQIVRDGSMCFVPVPFDPKAVFGKVRAPVLVTLNGYTLQAAPPAWDRWQELSFSHQREYAEAITEAHKPETRARRIASAVRMIRSRPAKRGRSSR